MSKISKRKRVYIGKVKIKHNVNKMYSLHGYSSQCAELCPTDVLLKQNVCHESGTLKNCGYITKALMQCWESFLKQEMQKRNGAYFFSLTFTKA